MLEIIKSFLRIGFTSFGGPVVAFSMIEDEIVGQKKWLSAKEFSRALALVKILPGPTATQLVVHTINLCKGRKAAIFAGISFLLPSYFCVLALGIFLGSVGTNSLKDQFEIGMAAAALAVIIQSTWRLGKSNIQNFQQWVIALISAAFVFWSLGLEPVLILAAGATGVFLFYFKNKKLEAALFLVLIYISLKAALFSFGTGLAIVPLLKTTVVDQLKLMSEKDFLEAIVLGQVTPGPVIMTVAWVGYKAAGFWGSLVSLFFIFLPGFIISLFVLPLVEKKSEKSQAFESFYKFAIPAVIGSMGAVALTMAVGNIKDIPSSAVLIASGVLLFWKHTPTWFLIPFFGLVSMALYQIPFYSWTF